MRGMSRRGALCQQKISITLPLLRLPPTRSIAYNKLNIFSSAITANKRINNADSSNSSSGATNENIMLTKWPRKAARKWFAIKLIAVYRGVGKGRKLTAIERQVICVVNKKIWRELTQGARINEGSLINCAYKSWIVAIIWYNDYYACNKVEWCEEELIKICFSSFAYWLVE